MGLETDARKLKPIPQLKGYLRLMETQIGKLEEELTNAVLDRVIEELKENVVTGYFPTLTAEEASNRTKKQAIDIVLALKDHA